MELHNSIAKISLKKFSSLLKTGKPNQNEWTILSTIVSHDSLSNKLEVLSLGTGSKCIGQTLMSPNGDILNDSHAEIICRRAFIKYLYIELNTFLKKNESDIFLKEDRVLIKPSITFHLFSTHMPCGDASIFPKGENDNFGNVFNENTKPECKRIKLDPDIHRTGAKCLKDDTKQDPKQPGEEYHVLGAVRTKPGRGDPTLSVSCSDKLAKWTILGIQGAFLFKLLQKPIYLSSITIANNTPFCPQAFKRALVARVNSFKELQDPFMRTTPEINQSTLSFEYSKDSNKQPSPASIIWFKGIKKVEVAIEGKKQGITKKDRDTKKGRVAICKRELFNDFCTILKEYDSFDMSYDKFPNYLEWKNDKNCPYFKTWRTVKEDVFKIWPYKDQNLLLFKFD